VMINGLYGHNTQMPDILLDGVHFYVFPEVLNHNSHFGSFLLVSDYGQNEYVDDSWCFLVGFVIFCCLLHTLKLL
jgi:hypothetical protein